MVSSPSTLQSSAPSVLPTRPLKRIWGWRSTSRKSALRRWASRSGSPVHRPRVSMIASTDAEVGCFSSKTRLPRTFLKCPRTYVTIMWRAQNSAAVCPGSKNHLAIAPPIGTGPEENAHRILPASTRGPGVQHQPRVAELVGQVTGVLSVGAGAREQLRGRESVQQREVAGGGLVHAGEQAIDDAGPVPRADQQVGLASTLDQRAAMLRAPSAWAWAAALAVAAGTSKRSGSGSAASSMGSPVAESPAACVTRANCTPRARSFSNTSQRSGRPADGISTAQGREAYGTWTFQSSSGAAVYEYCTG